MNCPGGGTGRRKGLKIPRDLTPVPVRFRPRAPSSVSEASVNIIFGNYGNPTIALIQWAFEQSLSHVYVVSINTGWHASDWFQHVEAVETYAKQLGFQVNRLKAQPNFSDLVRERQQFPSLQFQWCAGFLKGLPFLDWLDQHDLDGQAMILLGKTKSVQQPIVLEKLENSEHYGGRTVWQPFYQLDYTDLMSYVERAGFDFLPDRSQECWPCIHSRPVDLLKLSTSDIQKVASVEQELKQSFFEIPIALELEKVKNKSNTNDLDQLDVQYQGCGSPFACGE